MGIRWVGGVTAWAASGLLGLLVLLSPALQREAPDEPAPVALSYSEPWTAPIVWTGQLATQVCAPNGVGSCAGVRHGEQHDLHMVALEKTPDTIHVELRWDAATSGARELGFWVDAVSISYPCDDCTSYRFRVLGKAVGTSPLTIDVERPELREGESLAMMVRVPDGLPEPVMAQAWTTQPFVVEGTMSGD